MKTRDKMLESSEISVVLQGAIDDQYISKSIASIRKVLPDAELILSTWEGSDVGGLDYDVLQLNQDPGSTQLIIDSEVQNNMNRQILSTKNGLARASRKYCLKFRTDLALKNDHFLNFFGKYSARSSKWNILSERVLCNSATHPLYRVLHPTDITCFGYTEDVKKIWDIPLSDDENSLYYLTHDFPEMPHSIVTCKLVPKIGAEMFIWSSFLQKFEKENEPFHLEHNWDGSKENVLLTELTISNNLLVLDREDFDFTPLKHEYLLDESGRETWMDHALWKYYYKKHCEGISLFDLRARVIYPIQLFIYKLKYSPLGVELRKIKLKNILRNRVDYQPLWRAFKKW